MTHWIRTFWVVLLLSVTVAEAATTTIEEEEEGYLQMTIQRALETNAPELQHQVGMIYFYRRDRESLNLAEQWLRKAVDQDYAPSLHHLAVLLVSAQDHSYATPTQESHRLMERAAEQGFALSQNYMGGAYRDGSPSVGIEQNIEKAVEWYELAAQQGNRFGLYNLGLFYRDGIGVEQNDAVAVFLLMRSAEEGLVEAEFDLAMLLRYSEEALIEGQLQIAAEIFQELAEEGHPRAQFQYGYALAHGAGLEKDEQSAVEWYKKAVERKIPDAMNNLSVMYSAGRGVKESQIEAYNWAEKAAKLGHLDAQAKVAVFIMAGNGTQQNMDKGLAWMLMIDQRGHEMTHQFLTKSFGEEYKEKLNHLQAESDLLYREFGELHE